MYAKDSVNFIPKNYKYYNYRAKQLIKFDNEALHLNRIHCYLIRIYYIHGSK